MREIESRILNIMIFNLLESIKDDVNERLIEDREFLQSIMESKMNLDMDDILNPVRVDHREVITGKIIKVRALRVLVKTFESKRNILKANSFLRRNKGEIFNKIYIYT